MQATSINEHYLYPGTIFADKGEYLITTVLGSCVSVCLWDKIKKAGGMNHYLLPYYEKKNQPARYGDWAIYSLLDTLLKWGCQRNHIIAKVFGGGNVLEIVSPRITVGERNIQIAKQLLDKEKIPVLSSDVGGDEGRKIKYNTYTGVVSVKKILKRQFIQEYLAED